MVHSIGSHHSRSPFSWDLGRMGRGCAQGGDAAGTRVSQKLTAVERTSTTDLSLQVQTDEGDTVTLTLHRETDLSAISYRYRSRGPEGREAMSFKALSITNEQDLMLKIEGSLNETELADLRELVGKISASLEAGTLESAPGAEAGAELESLAGYSVSLSRSETLDIVRLRLREWQPTAIQEPPVAATPEIAAAPTEVQPVDTFTLPDAEDGIRAAVANLLAARQPAATPVSGTPRTEADPLAAWLRAALDQARERCGVLKPMEFQPAA